MGRVDGRRAKCAQGPHSLGQLGWDFEEWHADCIWFDDESVLVWDLSGSYDESVWLPGVLRGAELHLPIGHTDSPHSVPYSRYVAGSVFFRNDLLKYHMLFIDSVLGI
jgi:hypothetical protein